MEKQFKECNNSKKVPQKISFAIFDVDGTLREIIGNGKTKKVAQDILEKLIRIAKKGVNIGIISGTSLNQLKDRFCDLFIDPRWQSIKDKFSFYGELGLLECDIDNDKVIINEKFLNHPIRNSDFRKKIHDFIFDENKLFTWAPIVPEWREKDIMLNYAVPKPNLNHDAEENGHQRLFDDLKKYLEDIKCDFVYPIKGPTFIDITLKLSDGSFWDKDDACGRAISQWAKKFNKSIKEIEDSCIAFGDSLSDIKMALPKYEDFKLGNIAFAYVGEKRYFNPTPEQKNNTVICSLASEDDSMPWGPVITGQILDYLDDKFLAY